MNKFYCISDANRRYLSFTREARLKAYDHDLRNKVLEYLDKNGETKVAACKIFGISKDTFFRWRKLKRETGDVKPFGMSPRGMAYAIKMAHVHSKKRRPFTQKPIQKNERNSAS